MTKICVQCKQELELSAFNKSKARKDGHQTMCRECWKVYYKENYYLQGKEKERLARKRKLSVAAIREYIAQQKSVPCADCKGIFPPYVMDFDHLGIEEKLFNIGGSTAKSLKAVKAEIAKCEVVCANCHRIRTHSRVALTAGAA
jgi:hypothetical protein